MQYEEAASANDAGALDGAAWHYTAGPRLVQKLSGAARRFGSSTPLDSCAASRGHGDYRLAWCLAGSRVASPFGGHPWLQFCFAGAWLFTETFELQATCHTIRALLQAVADLAEQGRRRLRRVAGQGPNGAPTGAASRRSCTIFGRLIRV